MKPRSFPAAPRGRARLAVRWATVTLLAVTLLAGAPAPAPGYQERPPSADGIGKIFHGREIAHVMGHEGADWLERPERGAEERPDLLMRALQLRPGDVAADIGAGTGYYSWRLAREVGPTGRVYAVDIQTEMLERLGREMVARGVTNVFPVLGTITTPALPTNRVDLVLLVDVYHEFSHPHEMLTALAAALKTGGRAVFVEYRGEDPQVPIKPLHKMTEAQVRREVEPYGFTWEGTVRSLPWQHVIVFRKKPAEP